MIETFRSFISPAIVVVMLAAGMPCLNCTPSACGAKTVCALVHCKCCGPNCSWPKDSHGSGNDNAKCGQQCPLINAGKPAAAQRMQPLASAMLGIDEAQPRFFEYRISYVLPAFHHPAWHSATLLDLACALTV